MPVRRRSHRRRVGHAAGTFGLVSGSTEGSPNPTQWDNSYLENLFKFEWEQTKSPAGALQWTPIDPNAPKTADAHIPGQDPIPLREHDAISEEDVTGLKRSIMATGVSVSDLIFTAFSAAATYRNSDKRGGANGGRLALAPQKDWAVNRRTVPVIAALRDLMQKFNGQQISNERVSLADLIVLGGCAAIDKVATDAGMQVSTPFTAGRRDTTQELTDIEMAEWLRPVADGFRNYVDDQFEQIAPNVAPEEMFLDKAQLLALTVPEWVALVGGLRVLGANYDGSANGVFTDRVGVLSNDFFTVLTSIDHEWKKADEKGVTFSLCDRATGQPRFKATRSDLIFGSNSQLRAVAEAYAGSDGHTRFANDFVRVWNKVMMLDRFDIRD